jgi:hypothetical protein
MTTRWLLIAGLAFAGGCRPSHPPTPADELPPAYPRSTITDPKVAEVARAFTAWAEQRRAGGQPVFARVEVLPPVPILQPYGVGTYQKEPRLPVILTTGPGWAALSADRREAITAEVFEDLTNRLSVAKPAPPLKPTLTVQTREGLELAWVNDVLPGRRLLHGDGE